MDEATEKQLIALWQATVSQYRQTLAFLDTTGARVLVNSIDITDSERAETKSRIEHLEKLVAAIKVARHRQSTIAKERALAGGVVKDVIKDSVVPLLRKSGVDLASHPANIARDDILFRKH